MLDTEFRFDKKELREKFRKYLDQYDDPDADDFNPKHGKEVKYSKLDVLRKVQKLYWWTLNTSLIDLRRMYNHDDEKFASVKAAISSYITNKIRTRTDGAIYLQTPIVTFNGDKDEYEKWIVNNKRNQSRLIGSIVDELNNFIEGKVEADKNKPILNDEEYKEPVIEEKEEESKVVEEQEDQLISNEDIDVLFEEIDNFNVKIKLVQSSKLTETINRIATTLFENGMEKQKVADTMNAILNEMRENKKKFVELAKLQAGEQE